MTKQKLKCLNCDDAMPPFAKPKLYCSLACEQEAELIRYGRRCLRDNRLDQPDIQLTIRTRLAHIMAGGYDKASRRVPDKTREALLTRSGGKCEVCGKEGHDIDHTEGNSSAIINLQYLCKDCHNAKTQLRIVPIKPGTELYKYVKNRTERFWISVRSKQPMRICHDQDAWAGLWRQLLNERKADVLNVQKKI